MTTKKPRMTIYLSQEQRNYLEEWADKEKRTLSNLVGVLIDKAIQERQQAKDKENK